MTEFRIDIKRPNPGTNENEQQIAFIEPLREQKRIFVNNAYLFNLNQYYEGKECSYSPGFNYQFVFPDLQDATAFKLRFGGEKVE